MINISKFAKEVCRDCTKSDPTIQISEDTFLYTGRLILEINFHISFYSYSHNQHLQGTGHSLGMEWCSLSLLGSIQILKLKLYAVIIIL